MAALAWLLIPLVGVLVAVVWARWAARGRSVADGASLAGYERFRTAMQPGDAPPLKLKKGEQGETEGPDAEPV
ncbi:hypothetical protein [Streptomyces sp. NPDC049040]|uniref:hypothetical protein n=1 Tax=Streptomyces sp. NPDC049040 TaxID=3365593 RepID=UPI003712819E